MTTIIRTRNPLETLSMSQQPAGRRRSQRLRAAYDEEDDGFMFTRKKTKAAPADPEPAVDSAPKRTTKRKARDVESAATVRKGKGRKMSFSTPKADEDTISVPKRRRATRSSTDKEENGAHNVDQSALEKGDYDSIDMIGVSRVDETTKLIAESEAEVSKSRTIISLPFSDTPIINRNKELRKKGGGTRRSSLGLRGRRASSLIDNGHSAIPHREVEIRDFYKHIEAEGLSEPRRWKQLLTWTGERAIGEKPSHGDPDSAAILAARVIKDSLLKDFSNKSEFSDWFNREETAPTKIIKKPNPRNVEIEENLSGMAERIKRLREERDQWKTLAKPPSSQTPIIHGSRKLDASQIDSSLLDSEQAAILAVVASTPALDIRRQACERLNDAQTDLEYQVDQFVDGVHKLEQYQATASRAADKILALSAIRLDERDRKAKEEIGTRDLPMQEVLRSLSRILPEGGSGR